MMSTCNRLDLQTLGSQPVMSKNLPDRWSIGHRLCINFSISRANFVTTLRSHLDVSCYFWSTLFNVDVNYSYIYIYELNYSCFLKCIEEILIKYS